MRALSVYYYIYVYVLYIYIYIHTQNILEHVGFWFLQNSIDFVSTTNSEDVWCEVHGFGCGQLRKSKTGKKKNGFCC